MATKIRRSFTDEFKREAVSLLTSSGRPLTQVARELGIQPSMLRHWRDDRQATGIVMRTAAEPQEARRIGYARTTYTH
jgi:transposase-like protein